MWSNLSEETALIFSVSWMANPPFSIHIPWGMFMEANTTTVSRSCSLHPPQISSRVAAPLRFELPRCSLRTKVCNKCATLLRTILTLQCYGSLTAASWKRLSTMRWELRRMRHRYYLSYYQTLVQSTCLPFPQPKLKEVEPLRIYHIATPIVLWCVGMVAGLFIFCIERGNELLTSAKTLDFWTPSSSLSANSRNLN